MRKRDPPPGPAGAELLHIEHKLDNRATALSGGEMQRVAIGRALVREPAVYLMDEPLSSLDAKLRAELRLELKRIQRELGTTILYVTHDQIEAMTMADRIGVMSEGALVQLGTPREVYERPNTAYVASAAWHIRRSTSSRRSCCGAAAPPRARDHRRCGPSTFASCQARTVRDHARWCTGLSISAIRTTFTSSSRPIRW